MNDRDDVPNSPLRAGMFRSMGQPADRRVKKVRRVAWHVMDAVKDLLKMLFGFFTCGVFWVALNSVLGFWR